MNLFWFLKPPITYKSSLNGTIFVGKKQGNLSLFAGGVTQSGGELISMWDSLLQDLALQKNPIKKFVELGVGGGTLFALIHKYFPKAKMYGVELDPMMIHLAKTVFNPYGAKIIKYDAVDWVKKKNLANSFDLIIMDIAIGRKNPPNTCTDTFLRDLKRIIKHDGIIFYNALYNKSEKNEYQEFKKRCEKIFPVITEVFTYPLNTVLRLER